MRPTTTVESTHTPREEGTERHVGFQSLSHRFARGLPHQSFRVGVPYGSGGEIGSPIAPLAVATLGLQYTRGRRRYTLDSQIKSARSRHVSVRQIERKGRVVDVSPRAHLGHREEGLDLGRERKQPSRSGDEQGLLAHRVAGQQKPSPWLVPHRKREHPIQVLGERLSPGLVSVGQNFGVTPGTETVAQTFELDPELTEVVNLSVEDGLHRPGLVGHRLTARLEIDHAQAGVTERASPRGGEPGGALVWTTVR